MKRYVTLFIMLATLAAWQVQPYVGIPARMVVLDVGQGDAILLQDGNGNDCLVDGGPDNRVLEQLGDVMPPWDRTLECVILSHPDADHSTGLLEVLQRYKVEQFFWTGYDQDETVLQLLQSSTSTQFLRAGDRVRLGSLSIDVLWPEKNSPETNDDSLVLIVGTNETQALLTGDATETVEAALLQHHATEIQDIDVLKIGHHGSKTSSSMEFLQYLKPAIAVVSVGVKNRYGHPHPVVLARLQQIKARILRTDQQGAIFLPF